MLKWLCTIKGSKEEKERIIVLALDSQYLIPSVPSSSFYFKDEESIHNFIMKLLREAKQSEENENKKRQSFFRKHAKKQKRLLEKLLEEHKDLTRILKEDKIGDNDYNTGFESTLSRALGIKKDEESDLMIDVEFFMPQVQQSLILHGFNYKNKHYIYFFSSAGQIRRKQGKFLEEESAKMVYNKISAGLTEEEINSKGGIIINKLLAYLALSSSATDPWEKLNGKPFPLNNTIVLPDLEVTISGVAQDIIDNDYNILYNQVVDTDIAVSDGSGLCLPSVAKKPLVIRGPWLKGALSPFRFDDWIREKIGHDVLVTDIWGNTHWILKDNIQVILSESMLKSAGYFSSFEEYKERFKKFDCEIGYCNETPDFGNVKEAKINYQMLQSLRDVSKKDINKLVYRTQMKIDLIGNDRRTTFQLMGADETNLVKNAFQKSLSIYPQMIEDENYARQVINDTRRSVIRNARGGKLYLNSHYRIALPDPVAMCQWYFLCDVAPKGVLGYNEVSTSHGHDGERLVIGRSPALYFEHLVMRNNMSEEVRNWLETDAIYINAHDLTTKVLALDFDGDILLITNNQIYAQIVEDNIKDYEIRPLKYPLLKGPKKQITNENKYIALTIAQKYSRMGVYSNQMSKIWGREWKDDKEEVRGNLEALICLSAMNNQAIDAAKTLFFIEPSEKESENIRKRSSGKLPSYFEYAKDKTQEQVCLPCNSTMCRLSKAIKSTHIKFDKLVDGKFEFEKLASPNFENLTMKEFKETNPVISAYNYWNKRQNVCKVNDKNIIQEHTVRYRKLRKHIIEDSGVDDIQYIVDCLIGYLYQKNPKPSKKMLWGCFGEEMFLNLCNNLGVNPDSVK